MQINASNLLGLLIEAEQRRLDWTERNIATEKRLQRTLPNFFSEDVALDLQFAQTRDGLAVRFILWRREWIWDRAFQSYNDPKEIMDICEVMLTDRDDVERQIREAWEAIWENDPNPPDVNCVLKSVDGDRKFVYPSRGSSVIDEAIKEMWNQTKEKLKS